MEPARAAYAVSEVNLAVEELLGRPRTVLDVGCGPGQNGAVARARGARVTGLERDPHLAGIARTRLDEVLEVDITTDAAVAAIGERRFDTLVFADVLEHLVDPLATLRRFTPLLEDGGHVIVSLPNVAAWPVRLRMLRGDFRYEKSGILDETHLRFFTRESAVRLVEDAGLEVLSVHQTPMLVRAARDLLARTVVPDGHGEPVPLEDVPAYRAYRALVHPVESRVAALAPELLSFQTVVVARRRPAARKLSVVIGMLTYDEEPNVARMIDEVRAVAPDAELVLVDSSRDRTPDIAREKGATVLRQVPARGHGPAMELLMTEASRRADALVYLDCDFTYPVDQIPRIRALLEEGADVVNATRTRHRPAAMPLANYLANRTFAATARVVNGLPTTDVHSGMRGYRSSVIRAFAFDGEGDALPLDTLILPARAGYRVVEFPIPYAERGGVSKLRKLAGTAWTFVRIARAVGRGDPPRRYEVLRA